MKLEGLTLTLDKKIQIAAPRVDNKAYILKNKDGPSFQFSKRLIVSLDNFFLEFNASTFRKEKLLYWNSCFIFLVDVNIKYLVNFLSIIPD